MNARQLKFAQLVAANVPAGRAYVQAGYADNGRADQNASRLRSVEKVSREIARLQEVQAVKHEVSRDWLIEQHKSILNQSLAADDRTNATKSLAELTKLTGHYAPVKTQNDTKIEGQLGVNTNQIESEALQHLMELERVKRADSTLQ